jgi:hypothetical protein
MQVLSWNLRGGGIDENHEKNSVKTPSIPTKIRTEHPPYVSEERCL